MDQRRMPAARLAAAYVIFAGLWIIGSDLVIGLLPRPVELQLQTVKGLLFVAVSGLFLFFLVQRMYDDITTGTRQARAAEVLLQQVIDTVPVGVLFVNGEGVITFINPGAEQLLSIRAADAVGSRLEELCCVSDPETSARLGELLRTGSVDGMRLGRPDDAVPRAFIARAKAVDPGSNDSGWVVAVADITDAHTAGERMERLMRSYRFLADSLLLCGRATDPATLLKQIARLAVEHGGYVAAWSLFRPETQAAYANVALDGMDGERMQMAELLRAQYSDPQTGVAPALLAQGVVVSNDIERDPAHPWYAASGDGGLGSSATVRVEGSGGMQAAITFFAERPGHFDADEIEVLRQLRGALSFAFEKFGLDQERLDAEEALERNAMTYRTLFMSHPMPLWIYDIETLRFLAVNDAALRKYGWSREEFNAMTIADIRPEHDVPALMDNVTRVTSGFEDAGIWTHKDRAGRAFPVQVYSHTIDWEGHKAEMVMAQEIARMQ